jgi:hypothetical protein
MDQKNTLTPGVPVRTKMTQLMIAKNTKPDLTSQEWPYDYIYYNYYRTDDGYVVYQELYNANKEKQLNRMFIPDAMAEDFIALLAGEKLLED